MRKVGEGGFGLLAQAKKAPKRFLRRTFYAKCGCGYETKLSLSGLKYFKGAYKCRVCIGESKIAVDTAIANLAKRKANMAKA